MIYQHRPESDGGEILRLHDEFTPEQLEIQRVCREFAAREIRPRSLDIDEADVEVPWEIWHKAAELGLTSFMLPEELGGAGLSDCLTGCGPGGTLTRVRRNRQPDHVRGLLRRPGPGSAMPSSSGAGWRRSPASAPPLTALATTEPQSGSDAAAIRTAAERVDGGHVLNGQKSWISNGGVAAFYVVFATVAPGSGHRGITAFLVDKDDAGLSCGRPMRKMGQRAIVKTELFLEDVFVGDDRRLGASATGLARAALEYALEYAKERVQFGKPIAEHQAVAFRLADMALRVDASRLLVWRAARLLDSDEQATVEAAMAKLHASETAMWCTWAAVQTLGGWGYSRESGGEVDARRQARGDRGGNLGHPASDHLAGAAVRLARIAPGADVSVGAPRPAFITAATKSGRAVFSPSSRCCNAPFDGWLIMHPMDAQPATLAPSTLGCCR